MTYPPTGGEFLVSSLFFFKKILRGWLYLWIMDKFELSKEIIDVMVHNGLDEPWLMAVCDSFCSSLSDDSEEVVVTMGIAEGMPFLSVEIDHFENIFEVNYPYLNYYLMGITSGFRDRVIQVDMPECQRDGKFDFMINSLVGYLTIQMDMRLFNQGKMSLEEYDRKLSELL